VEPLLYDPSAAVDDASDDMPQEIATATPLCGWSDDRNVETVCAWKDPRACILCGLPGDDDAGLEQIELSDNAYDARLGRLLPFNGGLFVHSGESSRKRLNLLNKAPQLLILFVFLQDVRCGVARHGRNHRILSSMESKKQGHADNN
jgi:hypothetical protein